MPLLLLLPIKWGQLTIVVKNPPSKAGNVREAALTPGSGKSPGGGQSNPLQYFFLENPMDRLAGYRVAKSQTRLKRLSIHVCIVTTAYKTRTTICWNARISNTAKRIKVMEWRSQENTASFSLASSHVLCSICPLAPSTPCPPGGNHGKRSSDSETTSVLLISFFPSFSIENQELTFGMEKEMATSSSILAWRIPWTEEPGGLWSTGSQRVGHEWAHSTQPLEITGHMFISKCVTFWKTPNLWKSVQVKCALTAASGASVRACPAVPAKDPAPAAQEGWTRWEAKAT